MLTFWDVLPVRPTYNLFHIYVYIKLEDFIFLVLPVYVENELYDKKKSNY